MKKLTLGFAIIVLIMIIFPQGSYSQLQVVGHIDRPVQISANRNGPALYSQLNPLGSGFISSQEYSDPAFAANTSFAADDFIVPEGETWTVKYVDVAGAYFEWSGNPIYALNLIFYTDNNGIPGEVVHNLAFLSDYNEIEISANPRICKYEITLPAAIDFAAGHYWICAQSVGDETNRWGWMTNPVPTIEYEYQWKNPGDGYGTGYTDWTPGSAISWGDSNLAFALYGAGLQGDLAMVSIDSPITGAGLTSAEQVTVSVKNEGTAVMSGFDLSYSVDGGASVVENVGSFSLQANQTEQYTFSTLANLSTPGLHHIVATTMAAGDPIAGNNTAEKELYNLGNINVMPDTGTQIITICGASFTDSGGPDGNFGDNDNAVTTLLPENAGDRIKLTFLEFDASWGGFSIYNGSDTLAPLIGTWFGTNSPGVVNALNPSGSLTIHFMGPGWENTAGWLAFISCTTPVADDFAVLSLNCSLPTIFVGDVPQLLAKIQNYGSSSQEKTVTFKANGVVIGTQPTGLLGPADMALVSIPWVPAEAGNYLIEASVPADSGPDPNDFITIEKQVYAFGAFFEDFEGEQFPPENWRSGGLWARNTWDPYTGAGCAESFFGYNQSDTLITPRLNVEPGGVLSFAAKTSMWWPGNMDLYWLDEATGIRSFIQNIPLGSFGYDNFEVDLSAFAGIGRIGFFVNVTDPYSFAGNVLLDNVLGTGITIYSNDYDLKAKEFDGSVFYNVNEEATFTFNIRNDGLLAVQSGEYIVRLLKGGSPPEVLVSIPGNQIASFETQTYNFAYTFNTIGEFPVYAEIVYAADEYPVNNKSNTINLHGLASASEVVGVGNDILIVNWPIEFTVKKSLSETIYASNEINRTGVIFGIGYEYNFKADEQDAPVRIWMGVTDTLSLQTWIPATEMTLVYEGLISFPKGKQSVYIPFQMPFNYNDGSKNLIIMTEKVGTHSRPDQNYYGYGSMQTSTLVTASDVSIPDPYNPPTTGGLSTNITPNIRFVFNDNLGFAGGTVSEQGGAPIEGAKVVVNNLNITAYTDASGNYSMPFVPAGNYNATADKFTYMPVSQPLAISQGVDTDLDFTLGLLELVSVTGNITGDNNPGTGIANAVISLTGYSNFSTASNENGDFTIGGVYSFQTYLLKIDADGYDLYTDEIVVSDSDLDLGNIVLMETMLIPYAVIAQPETEQADIQWSAPAASAQYVLAFDDGEHENGYAGEPNEEVWLGNYFPVEEVSTVTSFDLYWAGYGVNTPQMMRLDVFDDQNKIVISSEEFLFGLDEWVNIDIPNITLHGNYYVMIHWSGLFAQSTFLAIDTTSTTPDYAFYRYPDGDFQLLSGLTGQHGTFLIHANVMKEPANRENGRSVNSYNISMGLQEDINNAGNWPLLNQSPLTVNTYTDLNWPPMASGKYLYAVKALYTNGESELSFSNILDFVYVNNSYVAAPELNVYPNPATDVVTITRSAGAELVVVGIDGRLYASSTIDSDNYQLDVSRFARGSYVLVVTSSTGVKRFKLLVN